jgi:hypothetical protein
MSFSYLFRALIIVILASFMGGDSEVFAFSKPTPFPLGPDALLTPGKNCDKPVTQRYPEGIPYCERDVTREAKENLIQLYDNQLGYSIGSMNRDDFKIDHFIPLCAGGSNDPSNLWPQHKSVYAITDPIETLICKKMALGLLSQATAIELVKKVKRNLDQAPVVMKTIQQLKK